jgi:competence protein ComEC
VVLSHPNLDHYSGLSEVAEAIPIGEVWLGEAFRRSATEGMPRQLLKDLKTRGVRVRSAAAGTVIPGLGAVSAEVLWPPVDLRLPAGDDNDASVVVRVHFEDRTILLSGDIGKVAQGRLVRDDPRAIQADALVLPHHGRTKTLDPDFLPAVRPQVAIASTATPRRPGQLAVVGPPGCRLLDTETGGMITVDLLPGGPCVTTFIANQVATTR